jgi:hypothetical protein
VGECLIHRQARRRGEPAPAARVWKYPVALLLALVLHGSAVVAAACARRVSWRGAEYGLDAGRVRLLQYRPYQPPAGSTTSGSSIA